jgi:hypothetical protein
MYYGRNINILLKFIKHNIFFNTFELDNPYGRKGRFFRPFWRSTLKLSPTTSTCLAKRATTTTTTTTSTKTYHLRSATFFPSSLSSSKLWFESVFYFKWIWHLIKSEKKENERDKGGRGVLMWHNTHLKQREWCHLEKGFSTFFLLTYPPPIKNG